MRKGIVAVWLVLLSAGILGLFWYHSLIYSLPTPIPPDYRDVAQGARIDIPGQWPAGRGKPLFLHFFNPDCPCSRFNIPHFIGLVKQYGEQVDFAIVPVSANNHTVQEIRDKFGLSLPVLLDTAVTASCGVYSTPQAVIIDANHQLYYRGNYNRSRYCTDKKTNYAQLALDSLLNHQLQPVFNESALKAYGCQLPLCTK